MHRSLCCLLFLAAACAPGAGSSDVIDIETDGAGGKEDATTVFSASLTVAQPEVKFRFTCHSTAASCALTREYLFDDALIARLKDVPPGPWLGELVGETQPLQTRALLGRMDGLGWSRSEFADASWDYFADGPQWDAGSVSGVTANQPYVLYLRRDPGLDPEAFPAIDFAARIVTSTPPLSR